VSADGALCYNEQRSWKLKYVACGSCDGLQNGPSVETGIPQMDISCFTLAFA
jgi:hypothetical protein